MSPERDPVPRAREPLPWLGGLALLGILGGGLLAAGVVLWENVDIERLTRGPSMLAVTSLPNALPPIPAAAPARPFRVAVFTSVASARFFPDSGFHPDLIARWDRLAKQSGAQVVRVNSTPELQRLDPSVVLVIPAAVCASDSEVEAFRAHASKGGGIVMTWAVGARDGACGWRGWDRVAGLLGARSVREVEPRDALYLTVPGGLPLSVGIDPATRIELRSESQLALGVDGPRLFWSDWALNAAGENGGSIDAAAWAGASDGGGRIAWFGFRFGQGATPNDEDRIRDVFRNGLYWAAGIPQGQIAPWPDGAGAALLIAEDVETGFKNAGALAAVLERKRAPATFFVVSQMTLDHPDVADILRNVGEVASQTSDHQVVAGRPYGEQWPRLRRSWTEIRGWTGDSARGLRPPEERFDVHTLHAWRDLGGTYLLAVNNARTASPEIFATPAGEVVLLPRVIKDDYNVFVQESAFKLQRLQEAYFHGLNKVGALGGLAVISLHSQIAGDPARVEVVGDVVDRVQTDGRWWIATGNDIATWWRRRRHISVAAEWPQSGAMTFVVTAPEGSPVHGATLDIVTPDDPTAWQPLVDGAPVPHARTAWGVNVFLPVLEPGGSHAVVLERAPGVAGS